MKKPKMVLFDYGQTLIAEQKFDGVKGTEAVLQYATKNKYHLSAEQIQAKANEINQEFGRFDPEKRHLFQIEIPNTMFTPYLYESQGIEIALSNSEIDTVFWDAAAPGTPTEGIEEFLEYLKNKGIRTGVISNISYAPSVVAERINRLLPENTFEFIITSSNFMFRKPNKRIFDLALEKAQLQPEDVWYIGDQYECDVKGSLNAGLLPVWYIGAIDLPYTEDKNILTINTWSEIERYMEGFHMSYMGSKPISLKNFTIGESTFWKEKMKLVRKEVIPYQWEILNDRIENAAPSFCMRNFEVAGRLMKEKKEKGREFIEPKYTFRGFESLPEDMDHLEDKFYGFVFQDSDFSKWIEAVAYSLMNHPDKELEMIGDKAIDLVCLAQQENGYLDTYYIINGMDKIFTNLRDHHELYCFGHLVEGAVAYYEATGKDKLLKAAIRFADFIHNYFGAEPEKCKGYPGHEIAEMALIRLYEAVGDEKYLNLSRFFIEERGKKPYYFTEKENHNNETNHEYHQSHLPVREQEEAVGHAVRAVYLYSGMADLARITGEEEIKNACKKLWKSIIREKMYITGGIGSTHIGEAFSYPFDLPNDTAYAETCASIGLMFFARRMLEMEINAEYADIMEQALYNTVLSGMDLDGKSFFYVNPLEVLPEACHKDERKAHVKPVRQKWFGCACCPPNLSRLISSLPSYAYTENEDTIFIHLYLGGTLKKEIKGKKAIFEITTNYPWEENVSISYQGEDSINMKLAIRIPNWCKSWQVAGNDEKEGILNQGYYYIEKTWEKGDIVTLQMEILPRVYSANVKVREDIGKVAVMKGPIVYCMEERDNSKDLHLYKLCPEMPILQHKVKINGKEFPALLAKGKKMEDTDIESDSNMLYKEYQPSQYKDTEIVLIPYYLWANRGENEMSIWIRV